MNKILQLLTVFSALLIPVMLSAEKLHGTNVVTSVKKEIVIMEPISGRTLQVINVALSLFEEKGMKLENYEVHVTRFNDTTVVSFLDPHSSFSKELRGSSSDMAELAVVVNNKTLDIERFNFIR